MAFIRKIELAIGPFGVVTDTLVSDLDLEFDIERSIDTEYNTANFTIYNAKEETRNNVLKSGETLRFKAGYEDEGGAFGGIFTGNIVESVSFRRDINWITEIKAYDIGKISQRKNFILTTVSYKSKTPITTVVKDLAGSLSIPVTGIRNIIGNLNNGFSYTGNITGLINAVKKLLLPQDLGVFIDDSEIVIYNKTTREGLYGTLYITPYNGLIGGVTIKEDKEKQSNKKRITFTTLLNYNIRPNKVIVLQNTSVEGTFYVDKVRFHGGLRSDAFFAEVEASE